MDLQKPLNKSTYLQAKNLCQIKDVIGKMENQQAWVFQVEA